MGSTGVSVPFSWFVIAACHAPGSPADDDEPSDSDSDTDTEPEEDPTPITESFTYTPPVVDVLFVIDASSSMDGLTEALISALPVMVAGWEARGLDFHAGVTDIDRSAAQGALIDVDGSRWVDPAMEDPTSVLMQMVDDVGDPSDREGGRAATYNALVWSAPGEVNEGFLRDDSQIAIVVHSDETDQSGNTPVSEEEFIDFLQAFRPEEKLAFHTITGNRGYAQVSDATGGVQWNVYTMPYSPALQAINDTLVATNVFTLSHEADRRSIEVRVIETDGARVDLDDDAWDYEDDDRTVDLESYVPTDGATVEITYTRD